MDVACIFNHVKKIHAFRTQLTPIIIYHESYEL